MARAEAALANAAAQRTYAARELERTRQLLASNAATDVELTAAQRQNDVAEAGEAKARGALAAARVQRDYTRIRAPISGVVGGISTQEGETVAASFAAPTFVTIVDLTRLEVQAYVDETDIGRVAPGQVVRFTVDAYPDATFEGHVTAIRPTADVIDNVVNYITLITIDERSGGVLRPEMTTTVNIELDGRTDALAVPAGVLRRDSEGTFVLVPAGNGAERRAVAIGFRGSDYAEVLDGLSEGERVLVGSAQPCTPTTAMETR